MSIHGFERLVVLESVAVFLFHGKMYVSGTLEHALAGFVNFVNAGGQGSHFSFSCFGLDLIQIDRHNNG